MVTPGVRREAVAYLCETHEVSERRACQVLEADRSSIRYKSIRPSDELLRSRLRDLSRQRRRFGYRRLHILLVREGWHINHKKLRRLYREEGLQVRKRGGRKRAIGTLYPAKLERGFFVTSFGFGQELPQKQFQASTTDEAIGEAKAFTTEHSKGCQASIRITRGRKPAGFDAKTKSLYFNMELPDVA
ncbi:IS3 family transposase [Sneathiella sp. P13V-1]|nr:IS3 family transposase [Sneathiella sp. P13V-1]